MPYQPLAPTIALSYSRHPLHEPREEKNSNLKLIGLRILNAARESRILGVTKSAGVMVLWKQLRM